MTPLPSAPADPRPDPVRVEELRREIARLEQCARSLLDQRSRAKRAGEVWLAEKLDMEALAFEESADRLRAALATLEPSS